MATKKSIKKKSKPAPKSDKKLSALDAAAQLLAKSSEPMNCQSLIEAMATKGLWKSPGGKTPHATLYAAISLQEIRPRAFCEQRLALVRSSTPDD